MGVEEALLALRYKMRVRSTPLSLKNLSPIGLDLFQLGGGAAREEGGLRAGSSGPSPHGARIFNFLINWEL